MYKLGVNVWCFPREIDLRNVLENVRTFGYKCLEPALSEDHLKLSLDEVRRTFEEIGNTVKEYNMSVETLATGLFWRYSPMDPTTSDKALEILRIQAEAAKAAGAKVLLVTLGRAIANVTYREMYRRAITWLLDASNVVKDYDVIIGVENVWNQFLAGPLEFRELIEWVSRDNVRVYFDIGNVLPHSRAEHWITELKDYIVAMHFKDFNLKTMQFCAPPDGSTDWDAVFRAIRSIGYKGPITAELPWISERPFENVKKAISFFKEKGYIQT